MDYNEEEKISWVTMNTYLNGFGAEGCGEEYNWKGEVILWAKATDYFPELSWDEFLSIARKYDVWNRFEEAFLT